jgi:hypothetical protein
MEWVEPLEKWKDYDDYGFMTGLETSHLIIVGAEGVVFTPEVVSPPTPSSLEVPALQIVSPLGKGIITTNPFSGELDDGQAVYIKDVKFPIEGSDTKNITTGPLSNAPQRRTDSLFLGVRIGDTVYFRVQMGASAGGLQFKETDFIPIEWSEDHPSVAAPGATELVEDVDGAVRVRKFSGSTSQYVVLPWEVPEDIVVSSGIEYQVVGFFTDAAFSAISSHTLLFKLSGYSIGHGDSLDGTFGTAQSVTLSGETHAQDDRFALDWSPTVTVTNLARGELGMLFFRRDVADNYPSPVGIYGVKIRWTREARR